MMGIWFSAKTDFIQWNDLVRSVMQMQVEVKCSVSNCEYWVQGNDCVASSILVSVDEHANANLNEEFALLGGGHTDTAQNSAQTCCHTFKPRKSS